MGNYMDETCIVFSRAGYRLASPEKERKIHRSGGRIIL